jgi:hypothetical protein
MKTVLFSILAVTVLFAFGCNDAAKPPVRVDNAPAAKPANSPSAAPAGHEDDGHDAPRITLAEAKKDFDNKAAVFIDTHLKAQFDQEHIPGAINIQANTIKQNFDKVPKGKKIIAYCS